MAFQDSSDPSVARDSDRSPAMPQCLSGLPGGAFQSSPGKGPRQIRDKARMSCLVACLTRLPWPSLGIPTHLPGEQR